MCSKLLHTEFIFVGKHNCINVYLVCKNVLNKLLNKENYKFFLLQIYFCVIAARIPLVMCHLQYCKNDYIMYLMLVGSAICAKQTSVWKIASFLMHLSCTHYNCTHY